MTALQDPPSTEPEVLIEEARRRQRRRRASLTGVAATFAAAAVAFWITSGGGPPSGNRHAGRGGGSGAVAAPVAASWHELSLPGGYLAGAELTNVFSFDGELLTFGYISERWPSYKRMHVGSVSCAKGCGPAVWGSTDAGAHWHPIYAFRSHDVIGSVVRTGRQLLMFAGSDVWRSTDGRHWLRTALPASLQALRGPEDVVADGNRLLLTGVDRHSPYDEEFWVSNDGGAHWSRSHLSLSWQAGASLIAAGHEFVVVGQRNGGWSAGWVDGGPAIWRSANGMNWTSSPLPLPLNDYVTATASAGQLIVEGDTGAGPPGLRPATAFLRSVSHHVLARVAAPTAMSGRPWQGLPLLMPFDGGFVAYVQARGWISQLWWSSNGAHWTRLTVRGAPPRDFRFEAVGRGGGSLIFINQAYRAGYGVPWGGNTFWRLTLSR